MRSPLSLFLLLLLLPAQRLLALSPQDRTLAMRDLQEGRADDALHLLRPATAPGTKDDDAQELLCRLSLQLEQWDAAVDACQQAVALQPGNSNHHLWYGRALGEKADRVSFITAFGLGKRVRAEFETAVALDPRNAAALSDLGEFYTEAPAIVGGGKDKAQSVASKLDAVDRARAEELRGRIADAEHQPADAEQHFRSAILQAQQPAAYWMVLASFFRKQNDLARMQDAILSGIAADKTRGTPLVDAAHLLLRAERDSPATTRLLREYLASPAKSEEEPAFRVHLLLSTLLAKQGEADAAAREEQAASTIASIYHPAKRAATNTGR